MRKTGEIWTSMKDAGSVVGVKTISDLVSKEMHGIPKTKNPTKEQINENTKWQKEKFMKSLII